MKKTALLLTGLLALLGAPLVLALMVAAVATPAAAGQLALLPCAEALPATGTWRPPFQQAYTVSARGFGTQFHPIHRQWRPHDGQDLASQPGPGPVVAISAGRVKAATTLGGYGNVVDVEHAGGVLSRYAHLASITVTPGQLVGIGAQLGVEGSTGTSTGNHLHLEIHVAGTPVDPVAFLLERGAPLSGAALAPTPAQAASTQVSGPMNERGLGFALPLPGEPRRDSLRNPPAPIPQTIKNLYVAAGDAYRIPWTLLAGIGMAETTHGANKGTSTAGAQGLMQFLPATWAVMGVDGDGDGRADPHNDADAVHSAARYLVASDVTRGADGARKALWSYNHADWYVNDVLSYAQAYGGGTMPGDPTSCGTGKGEGDSNLAPLTLIAQN